MVETSTKYNRYAAGIPKRVAVVGVIDSLSFDVQGRWHFGPILADRKSGEGHGVCKDWTFFMMSY